MLIERRDDVVMYVRRLYYLLLDHQWAHVPEGAELGDGRWAQARGDAG